MGKIICEKHREQGIVLTCEHVRQDILTGTSATDCVITTTQELGSFGNEIVVIRLGYCDTCAKQYGLPLHDAVLPEPPDEVSLDSPGGFGDQLNPVCTKCFEVFKTSLRSCE